MNNKNLKKHGAGAPNPIQSIMDEFARIITELLNLLSRGIVKGLGVASENLAKRLSKKNNPVLRASEFYKKLKK